MPPNVHTYALRKNRPGKKGRLGYTGVANKIKLVIIRRMSKHLRPMNKARELLLFCEEGCQVKVVGGNLKFEIRNWYLVFECTG